MTDPANSTLEFLQKYGDQIADMKERVTPKNREQRRTLARQERLLNKKRRQRGLTDTDIVTEIMTSFITKLQEKEQQLIEQEKEENEENGSIERNSGIPD